MPFLFLSGRREKAVRPVYFPFVEQPDLDGVFGAVEGAAHAHQAVAAEAELSVLVRDIVRGAGLHALHAVHAAFVHAVHFSVPAPAPVLHAHDPRQRAAEGEGLFRRGDARGKVGAVDGDEPFRRLPHAVRHFVRMAENDVVGHHIVVFALEHIVLFFKHGAQFAR